MKNLILLCICTLVVNTNAQNVGINSTGATPNTSAMLDIVASDKGLLIPRVTLSGTGDVTTITGAEPNGLLVYNTTAAGSGSTAVLANTFYFWDAAQSKWIAFNGSGGRDWALLGNAGTTAGTNFLGTTDGTDMVFKTNSTEVFRMGNTNKNVMVNATTNSTDFLSSTANSSLNAIGAYVSGTSTKRGIYALSSSTGTNANAIYAEASAVGPHAIEAVISNASSTSAAIHANSTASNTANGIFSETNGVKGYSSIYAISSPTAAGTAYDISNSHHTITAQAYNNQPYTFGVYGYLNGSPNNSAGVIGLYSATQWGGLGYRESASLIYGVFGYAGNTGTNIAGHFRATGGTSNIAIRMTGSTSGTLDISPAATTTSHALIMPASQGALSTVLTNDGAGNLSWGTNYGSNIQYANGTTSISTTSATYVDMAGATITFTPKHSTVYVYFTASGDVDVAAAGVQMGYVKCRITDATATTVYSKCVSIATDNDDVSGGNGAWNCAMVTQITGLTVGVPTTIKAQWCHSGTNPGTARCDPSTDYSHRSMMIMD